MVSDPRAIAVVDDDPSIRQLLERVLTSMGYAVHVFPNYKAAVDSSLFHQCSIYLCDMVMDEGDGGADAIPQIKANKPDAMVIAMSAGIMGMLPGAVLKLAQKVGADHAVKKPIDLDNLVKLIAARL